MSDEDVALEVTTLDHDPTVEIRGADRGYSITCYARRGAKTAVRTSLDEALSYASDFLTRN